MYFFYDCGFLNILKQIFWMEQMNKFEIIYLHIYIVYYIDQRWIYDSTDHAIIQSVCYCVEHATINIFYVYITQYTSKSLYLLWTIINILLSKI